MCVCALPMGARQSTALDAGTREGDAAPSRRHVYLAGYEVFFSPNEVVIFSEKKRAICEAHGLVGYFPGDLELREGSGHQDEHRARAIYELDLGMMRQCGSIVANLTPFRGPSADAGTCWELGHFVGAGKLALAYTNERRPYEDRFRPEATAEDGCGTGGGAVEGYPRDECGCLVDMQTRADNCMLTECVSHLEVSASDFATRSEMLRDLGAFQKCIHHLASMLDLASLVDAE